MSNSNPSFSNANESVLTIEALTEAHDRLGWIGVGTDFGGFSTPTIYDGCKKCMYYSQLFGGRSGNRVLDSEEAFEIAKQEFVQHFNDKHKDLIMKRRQMPKKKLDFTEKSNSRNSFGDTPYTVTWNLDFDMEYFGTSMFHSLASPRATTLDEVEYINGIPIVPSKKKKKPKVNVRNLDRNARFRARIAHPQIQQDAQVMAWRNRPQVIFADEGIYQPVVTSEIRFENGSSITVPTNEERATEVDRERIVELYGGRQTGRTTIARIQNEYNRRSEED